MLHDSVGAESWKRLSAVASVNPQEDKEMAIRSCSPQQWGCSLGGRGGCRTVSEALFEICWAYLLFRLRIYAGQTQGLSLRQYHCEMVHNKLGGVGWVAAAGKHPGTQWSHCGPWLPLQKLGRALESPLLACPTQRHLPPRFPGTLCCCERSLCLLPITPFSLPRRLFISRPRIPRLLLIAKLSLKSYGLVFIVIINCEWSSLLNDSTLCETTLSV